MVEFGLEALVTQVVRLVDRAGGARPGRKVLTLVTSNLAGGSHIDDPERLRAGTIGHVLPFRVVAPSTLGASREPSPSVTFASWPRRWPRPICRAWSLGPRHPKGSATGPRQRYPVIKKSA